MLCDNCKKREANVRYSENINGIRRELNLCEECSKKLGIGEIGLDMPINFSSFLGDFFGGTESTDFLPSFTKTTTMQCDNCGTTFEDIVNTGRLGCANCYEAFGDKLDAILKAFDMVLQDGGDLPYELIDVIEKWQAVKEKYPKS